MLLLSRIIVVVDDEEFVALYDSCRSGNPELPYYEYPRFVLEDVDEEECCVVFF